MKKILLFAALVLGAVSCMKDQSVEANLGGDGNLVVTVALPDAATRAAGSDSSVGAIGNINLGEYDIRYVLEVFDARKELAKRLVQFEDNATSTTFELRLIPGRDYNFVVWADFVKRNAQGEVEMEHYNVTTLRNVTFADNSAQRAMDESRDAYTGVRLIENFNSTSSVEIPLKRPFAKLRIKTNDLNAIYSELQSATVNYTSALYSSFDALVEVAGGELKNNVSKSVDFTNDAYLYANEPVTNGLFEEMTLFADYLFGTEDGTVQFTLDVTDNKAETIPTIDFNTTIPVERNHLTTIYGPILTDYNKASVTINPVFENDGNFEGAPYYQVAVTNGFELVKAFYDGVNFFAINDIVVTNADVDAYLATRAAVAINPVFDLNGYTVTFVTENNETLLSIAEGSSLTVTDSVGNGAIVVDGDGAAFENNGSVNIKGGSLESNNGSVIVNNGEANISGGELNEGAIDNNGTANIAGGELNDGAIDNNGTANIVGGKLNEGAITNTTEGATNITGGEFTYTPEADDVVEGFEVKTDENGVITIVECDPVAMIGDVQYTTLKAAFEAVESGQTITLLTDVTTRSTAVLAEGKTAILDLNGKTLAHTDEANQYALSNLGTLTITGNGTVNSRGIYNGYGNGGENVATAMLTIVNGSFNAKGTNGGAAVFNYGIVNVNGGEFTSIGGYSLNNQSGASMTIADGITANNGLYATGATITINGGEISGNRSGCHVIYAYNSAVTINGGTLYNNNSGNATVMAAGSTKITYNGGTYGIKDGRVPGNGNTWTSCLLDSQNSAEVVVNDGTYNGGFRVQAGTSMTINGGSFNDCYGSNYNIYGTATVKGGTYTDDAAKAFAEKYVAEGYILDGDIVVKDVKVAKVGNTEYRKIDDAIAAWTNNTTLTLMSDVALNDVVTLKSTEHHILNLGTYTLTAASGKNAIEITCNGRTSASYALTVNADGTNPGGIKATGKSCIYYKKSDSTKDRPIILINNGVFTGSYSINSSSNGNTNCPQIWINGGVFNSYMNLTKNMLKVSGGTFHAAINCTGDSSAYRQISGGRFKSWQFMTADAPNKFWVGTAVETYDVGVYVDDEGYLVVGGPVITEFGDKFVAKATNATKWSSYLKYSSAAANGLYYTNADMAIKKHGEANVVLK